MVGTDIGLKHLVAEIRYRELLAEAERRHTVDTALEARTTSRRQRIIGVRTALATALLRVGSWLMPDEAASGHAGNGAFGLRPGQ